MLKKINRVLLYKEKLYLLFIFFGAFLASSIDVIGIGSIVGYISFLSNPEKIISKIPYDNISNYLSSLDQNDLVIFFSISLVSIFLFKNIFLLIFFYFEALITKKLNVNVGTRLLNYYLKQNYTFYLNNNPSKMVNSIITESSRFVVYIFSVLLVFRELIVLLLLMIFLFNLNSSYSFKILSGMALFSGLFFFSFRNVMKKIGIKATKYSELNYKVLYEIFLAIKSIKLLNRNDYWINKFQNYKDSFHQYQLKSYIIGRFPRIFLEIIAVITLSSIILILFLTGKTIFEIVSLLTLIGLIFIRSLPAFINISAGINSLSYNSETFNITLSKLYKFSYYEETIKQNKQKTKIKKVEKINLSDVNFGYLENKKTLSNISLELKKGKIIGIIGKTGSGKTTLVDLITGLIKPQSGKILINNLNYENAYTESTSYVTQDTILIDDSIKNNICLGIDNEKINNERLTFALTTSCVSEFAANMPEKENSFVGDRGIRISGGQKQRIGIARAIYNDFEILVLDEATSSLDYSTEKQIMTNISNMKENKIILVITHRLSALEFCDEVVLLEDGKIKEIGKIDQIKNKHKEMFN